jgi:tetratricopeptide (TPR) repeat protein
LYRLERYEESAEASKAAIRLYSNFRCFYNLGLAHFATGNWPEAKVAFRRSVELGSLSSWEDEYTEAYYYLGLSSAKSNEIHTEIKDLENHMGDFDSEPIKRFELANLYLCDGRPKAAKEQYRILKKSDPELANELLKLIKKHYKPA